VEIASGIGTHPDTCPNSIEVLRSTLDFMKESLPGLSRVSIVVLGPRVPAHPSRRPRTYPWEDPPYRPHWRTLDRDFAWGTDIDHFARDLGGVRLCEEYAYSEAPAYNRNYDFVEFKYELDDYVLRRSVDRSEEESRVSWHGSKWIVDDQWNPPSNRSQE
jgi:hypothetical protein